VVNRLLFPYLFSAVELMSATGMDPADIDRCMTRGAGVPMGPIALLDFVGLDVAQAIGEAIGAPGPATAERARARGGARAQVAAGLLQLRDPPAVADSLTSLACAGEILV
jgi:3-hydroxyacyl-CoA dehydrogenase